MSVIDRTFNGSIISQEIQSNNNIQVYILGKAHWLAAHEITYLEGDGNYTYIYTRRGKRYLVSKNMKTIQETLNAGFLRVHKSYTINPYHLVARLQSDMLLLSCGKEIPIARRRIRETHEMLAGHN
jgi:two-component system LytT family response regulator